MIVPGLASSPLRHASVKSTESLANFSIGLTNIKKFTTSHRKWVAAGAGWGMVGGRLRRNRNNQTRNK